MRCSVSICVTLLLVARGAAAQDAPRFGIVMGYPAEVGVVWTVANRVAVRPEVNWTHSTVESTTTSTVFTGTGVTTTTLTTTNETNAIGYGVSGLLYVSKRDAFRAYIAPRLAYSRTKLTIDRPVPPLANIPVPVLTGTETTTYTASGALGAQYSMARRFGVFGEVGVAFARSTLAPASSFGGGDSKNRTVGIRSGAGVILFFGS